MTLLYKLPESVVAVCRDLSQGILRRDPWAKVIPGVALGSLRREKAAREARLRAEANDRRASWREMSAAMALHAHQCPRLPDTSAGFSARKADLMGRRHRATAGDPKPRLVQSCEPATVSLPGWLMGETP